MKENKKPEIDIVFPWVDGTDPVWQASKRQFAKGSKGDDREERFREWGILKYVFRGIEKNLPWVRKVHFITCGHLPDWLDTSCPKLHVVKHSDYIPEQWLPTFSSHPIELNIHRIQGLSEQFIYMNDDDFFIHPMKPEDFFTDGLPKSQAGLEVFHNRDREYIGILHSDLELINRNFNSRDVLRKNYFKFVNHKYEVNANLKTILLAPWCVGYFPGFSFFHGPNAYLKSTLEEVWEKEQSILSETCSHRFRTYLDVSQCTFMWWQWCKGSFVPCANNKRLIYLSLDNNIQYIKNTIEESDCSMLCLNDAAVTDVEEKRLAIHDVFESIFGEKSQFEL